MTELLTAAQMRAIEQAAIDSGDVTGLELMERAGRGVVDAVFEEWPELAKAPHRTVVLCGPGNNGGDGFVVARLLKEWGWDVDVYLYGDPAKLPPDAKVNYERWLEQGKVCPLLSNFEPSVLKPAIVIDALFGTGLTRPVRDLGLVLLDTYDSVNMAGGTPFNIRKELSPLVVSIDIPSGLCNDSGRALIDQDFEGLPNKLEAPVVTCDMAVSFHRMKLGHVTQIGPSVCGKVVVVDIGLRHAALPDIVREVCGSFDANLRKQAGHKYGHGHALILSGGPGKTGAARLAARGALRIGAGLVTLGVPPSAQQEVACHITSEMLTRVADAEGLVEVLKDDRLRALCIGPGFGLSEDRAALIEAALQSNRHTVLDADALTQIAQDQRLFAMLHENCVLTPHGGEFARLFPDIAEKLNAPARKGPAYSKVDATREAAKRAGCVVLFKGPDTVIAGPDGRCSINSAQYERAAPWLATAGAGDVLAGFISGLLARGLKPMQAAETGAWLHVECARSFGPGLIAEDLPDELPKVLRNLGV